MRQAKRLLAGALLAALAVPAAAQDRRVADADVADWVNKRVRDWQPTADERRFDDVGWAADIRAALKLARENNRPVFLFTHDGHMAVGRCSGGAEAISASSLSNPNVIDLLNRCYVPVYLSNEDFRPDGGAPPEEKKERDRILREAGAAKLSVGTVHAYVLNPDGHPVDSLHVATAARVELQRNVDKLGTKEGKPLVAPAPQSKASPPPGLPDANALLLHLTARNLVRQGDDLVPPKVRLGETKSGSWGAYPAEDWVVLGRDDWAKLLPPGAVKEGQTWEPDRDAAAKVLLRFYPATENNDLKTNRIERQEVRAKVLSVKDGVAVARLDGSLRMKHPFYHKDDDNFVEAAFVGVMAFDADKGKVRSLHVATERAVYGGRTFGVAVRSVP